MTDRKIKQPRETEDFDIHADRRLGDGDSITSVTASYEGPDATLTIDKTTFDQTVAKVWISGGTNNCIYKVTAIITSSNGRKIEAEFNLLVKDL